MNCSNPQQKPDWHAYALRELSGEARRAAEAHGATCPGCREEAAALRLTLDAMASLRDEEVPRRVAFVSDKVFEPRWWQIFLSPTFAAAAVIALAIVGHGWLRPGVSEAQVQARVDAAVSEAVERAMIQVDAQQRDLQTAVRIQSGLMSQVYIRGRRPGPVTDREPKIIPFEIPT